MHHSGARVIEDSSLLLVDDVFSVLANEAPLRRSRLTHWLIAGDEEKASTPGARLQRIEERLKALSKRTLSTENSM